METVWAKEYSLQEFVDPKQFKSYDDLKARLYKVLALDGSAPTPKNSFEEEAPAPKQKAAKPAPSIDDDEDDEGVEFFKKLAEEEA